MPESLDERDGDGREGLPPGTLTGIMKEIADAPRAALGDAWEQKLRPGAVVGRFELVREIGLGGFGVVYEARDRELGRTVAFKAVRTGDRAALREERLLREAEAAARLSHPNIVTLFDAGRCEHGPFLVLELLRGQTLADRLDQGRLSVREAVRIAVEVARALAYAHAQGVVHRDLKPANVFLCDEGQVKLLDFGLAHALGRRRMDGGTPAYMAPEQWKGAPEDERTDVFALGVVLYRMLAGELPFPDGDGGRALESARPAPALDVPGVPALGELLARTLEKDPVGRPRDGAAVLAALSAFQRELEATPSAASGPVRKRPRWRRLAVGAAALAVAALAAGIGAAVLRARTAGAPGGEPVSVAVADFANQTGEPELDGLSGMLITSLEQSHRLTVLTRVRMLDLLHQLGKSNATAVDEPLGRELALSAGVRALVLASIRRFDQVYAIELKVLDPVTSEYLFTLKEEGRGKASVPAMIDRLSEQTRERLRETPAEVEASRARVADLTTSSLAAYQHYFRGEQLKEAIRYEPALEEYRKAIAIDPTFALAHYRIAYLGKFTALDDRARRDEIEAALRNADRVPEKERLLITAWKAVMDGRKDDARALYARVIAAYPQDKEALFMAGDQLFHDDQAQEALPFFQRAVALDPGFEPALMHTADCLAELGRTDELMDLARRWTERTPSAPAFRALAMALGFAGRIDDAVAAARRALELDGSRYSRAALAELLMFSERYGEAEELARAGASPGAPVLERAWAVQLLATASAYQGRRREALRIADEAPEGIEDYKDLRRTLRVELLMGGGPSESVLHDARAIAKGPDPKEIALVLALLGDLDAAADAAARMAPAQRGVLDAIVAWRRGERDRALALARAEARTPNPHVRAAALLVLANAALEAGRLDEAAQAAEAFERAPMAATWRSWAFPRSLYVAAVAHEQLGDRRRAREEIDHLLRIWSRADADLPGLADARALKARLGRQR